MSSYELGVFGAPTQEQEQRVRDCVAQSLDAFQLRLGEEVGWHRDAAFAPQEARAAAAMFFGGVDVDVHTIRPWLESSTPIVPVVSDLRRVGIEIPPAMHHLNCLSWTEGPERVAATLLESAGLLPRQRRVFLSYKRSEAREAALQLFDAFSARQFDVFLDTHGVPPAVDFQAMLWHRLCESDVLVMLDSPSYFDSRWTSAEYGRALAKGIAVLRVGWPDVTPSTRTATASRAELLPDELDAGSGRLAPAAVQRICDQLERVRSEGHAVRHLNLVSKVRQAITTIGGRFLGVGSGHVIHLELPDGRAMRAFPTVGVPSSQSMHWAAREAPGTAVAVVYEPVGLLPEWVDHLRWLGQHIRTARWVDVAHAAWDLADWSEPA